MEVADTTLRTDMGRKLRIYAEAGIPEYWVVDLKTKVVHRMWMPKASVYAEIDEVALGSMIDAATIEGLRIATHLP